MPPFINEEKCTGCALCAQICPVDVFSMNKTEKKPAIKYPDECWHCNACVLDCPSGALALRVPLTASLLYMDAKQ